MIFMSRDSCRAGCRRWQRAGKMRIGVFDPRCTGSTGWWRLLFRSPSSSFHGVLTMQWQTPVATDLRFGFEITMYVAAR
jgi:coenzyme PQQ precursor peptide PqqA